MLYILVLFLLLIVPGQMFSMSCRTWSLVCVNNSASVPDTCKESFSGDLDFQRDKKKKLEEGTDAS